MGCLLIAEFSPCGSESGDRLCIRYVVLLLPLDFLTCARPSMSPSIDIGTPASFHPSEHPEHPFNKLWRGDKQRTVSLDGIPKFDDPFAEREWIKVSNLERCRELLFHSLFRNIWLLRFVCGES